jgi:hypothetical protein
MVKKTNWKDTAELIGIAAIVASLVFVGLELQQAQTDSRIESSLTRAEWFFANRDAINEHADVWSKGYAGDPLTEAETLIFENLVKDIATNNRFSWVRERMLGSTQDYPAHELAWILHKSPAALAAWEAFQSDSDEMRRTLMPDWYGDTSEFAEIVRADLRKLAQSAN